MCGLLHTWISIFDIAIPYLRPNKATNWNFLVPSGLFVTKAPCSSPFSPAQHNCWREESPNMWNTFLGQVIIFFLWVNEGNYKNWGEENDLWTCSNCLDFFSWFFIIAKSWILGFWRSVSGEKNKKMWKTTVLYVYVENCCIRKYVKSLWFDEINSTAKAALN